MCSTLDELVSHPEGQCDLPGGVLFSPVDESGAAFILVGSQTRVNKSGKRALVRNEVQCEMIAAFPALTQRIDCSSHRTESANIVMRKSSSSTTDSDFA